MGFYDYMAQNGQSLNGGPAAGTPGREGMKAQGSGLNNYLFGGDATKGMPDGPKHGDYMSGYIQNQLGTVGDRPAPTFNSLDAARARADQTALVAQLRQIAAGDRAGAGEMAVNRQMGQAQAAQQAQAQASRGSNAALAARTAARNTSQLGTTGAGMAAGAQMQDQSNAMGQLSGVLNGMRGQDIAIGQGNQNANLQQTQMNQSAQLGYLAQLLGIDQVALQQDLAKRGLDMQDKGIFPQLLAAGGQIAGAAAGKP